MSFRQAVSNISLSPNAKRTLKKPTRLGLRVLYTFAPNKSFGQLLETSQGTTRALQTFNRKFNLVWYNNIHTKTAQYNSVNAKLSKPQLNKLKSVT